MGAQAQLSAIRCPQGWLLLPSVQWVCPAHFLPGCSWTLCLAWLCIWPVPEAASSLPVVLLLLAGPHPRNCGWLCRAYQGPAGKRASWGMSWRSQAFPLRGACHEAKLQVVNWGWPGPHCHSCTPAQSRDVSYITLTVLCVHAPAGAVPRSMAASPRVLAHSFIQQTSVELPLYW